MAFKKSAWQKYPYLKQYFNGGYYVPWGADKAVDGNYLKLSANGDQCTISAGNKLTAEWGVDLGKVLSMNHIFIQYRTENDIWGMFVLLDVCFPTRIIQGKLDVSLATILYL